MYEQWFIVNTGIIPRNGYLVYLGEFYVGIFPNEIGKPINYDFLGISTNNLDFEIIFKILVGLYRLGLHFNLIARVI